MIKSNSFEGTVVLPGKFSRLFYDLRSQEVEIKIGANALFLGGPKGMEMVEGLYAALGVVLRELDEAKQSREGF